MNLTNKLNFSLTKKRLVLIGKKLSTTQLYTKALPALIAFSFSPFLFFNPFDASDDPYSYLIRDTYSDVELQRKSLIAEGDSIYSLAQIPYLVLTESGEPYTGVQKTYSKETDRHVGTNIYVDGLIVHLKIFDEGGTGTQTLDTFYDAQKTKKISTRFYQNGTLSSEMIFSSPDHDGKRLSRFWHPDGYLRSVMISEQGDFRSKTSELINYDPEGNVEFHERYLNGELLEKIK
ncbi:MAG: hypothetical protein ED557_10355 [Balneola sp.]|nr:MAG: hypothetical protein ED557_10355 [Balneola sp.]